jgi:ribosomal-protein-alanine N-acetyltransferase
MMTLEESERLAVDHVAAGDLDALVEIERKSFSDPWSTRDFSEVMSVPHSIFLVAKSSAGEVAAYAIAMAVEDESEILNIAVAPE